MPMLGSSAPAGWPPRYWDALPGWVQKLVTYYLRRAGVLPRS